MADNIELFDLHGRPLRVIVGNTSSDGTGTPYIVVLDSSGRIVLGTSTASIGKLAANSGVDIGDVDILSIAAGTNSIGKVSGVPFSVAEEQVIDASLGAYTAGDVVGADDCCTTLAVVWEWDVANAAGGYVLITNIKLINETENQAVQYDLFLSNTATILAELRDNAASTYPLKTDYTGWLGKISLPQSIAEGSTVATHTEAFPGDGVSGLPKLVKCAAADTKIYGVLLTNTAYTQTATDKIRIIMSGEKYL